MEFFNLQNAINEGNKYLSSLICCVILKHDMLLCRADINCKSLEINC
jgi:hypothetical protein